MGGGSGGEGAAAVAAAAAAAAAKAGMSAKELMEAAAAAHKKEQERVAREAERKVAERDARNHRKSRAMMYFAEGNVEFDKKHFKRAAELYTLSLSLEAKAPDVLFNRGNVYRNLGLLQQAIDDYNAALAINPRDASSHVKKGVAYSLIKDPAGRRDHLVKAVKCYDRAIRVDEVNAEAFVKRGLAYKLLGSLDHAVADFSVCIGITQGKTRVAAEAYHRRGEIFASQGKLSSAIHDLDNAIRLDPKRFAH